MLSGIRNSSRSTSPGWMLGNFAMSRLSQRIPCRGAIVKWSSFQESASPHHFGAQSVVQRIIEGEQVAQLGRQAILHGGAQHLLLVLLLGLVAAAVEGVEGGARPAGAV